MSETMADFEKEIEASFRPIKEGDVVDGTVTAVDEEAAWLAKQSFRNSADSAYTG